MLPMTVNKADCGATAKRTQGLKPIDSIEFIGTAEQLAKKGEILAKSAESIPQGLKAALTLLLYAGDKSPAYLKTEFFCKV